jgi:phenylpropionate dioxygenase-like ring-hydroxylating dioxygenase large terminal subunit
VFLNTCTHRGNKLCLYDRGRSLTVACSYHGWSFDPQGKLVGVPLEDRVYYGALDREKFSLTEARVELYGDLIFATWDLHAPPLREHLGEIAWWLDVFLLEANIGGMEVLQGSQRYVMPANWKLTADNFIGDRYHVPTSHASYFKLRFGPRPDTKVQPDEGDFTVALRPAHGLGGISTTRRPYDNDMRIATTMGPEAVEWVDEYYARLSERTGDLAHPPTSANFGTVFPNFMLQGSGVFQGRTILVVHPRGPNSSEIWQWQLTERRAPPAVKRRVAQESSRRQSAAGLVGADDGENFERIAEAMAGVTTREYGFHYGMGVAQEPDWPGRERWHLTGVPGRIGPEFTEANQRLFYRHWAELMGLAEA